MNSKFTESLRDAIEIAYEQGDEDLCTVRIGKHFFDSLFMLRAFESYCTRQVNTLTEKNMSSLFGPFCICFVSFSYNEE